MTQHNDEGPTGVGAPREGVEEGGGNVHPIRLRKARTLAVKNHSGTALVDPAAKGRVERAALAAGFDSIEQFVDFVADAGLIGLPPSDGITERYTLEDLGLRLWTTMQSQPTNRRAEWFAGLAENQQKAVIVVLKSRGFSTQNIAREFGVEERGIRTVWNAYADDLGAQVVGVRLNVIAGELQAKSEQCFDELMRIGKPKEAFGIHKDTVSIWQSLGIVDRAVQRVHHVHDVGDATTQEIDRLVAIREKKAAAEERVKRIEVEIVERPDTDLPDEVAEGIDTTEVT